MASTASLDLFFFLPPSTFGRFHDCWSSSGGGTVSIKVKGSPPFAFSTACLKPSTLYPEPLNKDWHSSHLGSSSHKSISWSLTNPPPAHWLTCLCFASLPGWSISIREKNVNNLTNRHYNSQNYSIFQALQIEYPSFKYYKLNVHSSSTTNWMSILHILPQKKTKQSLTQPHMMTLENRPSHTNGA